MASFLRSARVISRALPASRVASRSASALRTLSARQAATRAFSTSRLAWSSGQVDIALSQKLQEELKFEEQNAAEDAFSPAFLEEFNKEGIWKIEDTAGHDEVALVREFGNEQIRVLFSIADLDTPMEEPELETEEGSEPEASPSSPIRVAFTISKTGKGALSVDAILDQEGTFVVDNISYYDNAKVATENTAEADWTRRGLYIGPQFDHLDVSVQEQFEAFLQERGINSSLALFIPAYAEYKEQKEYTKWLGKVKAFVDA
ncbi:mitochondrial glycoprotein [Clavulina sp. PMI_390]|nr:mitochondrial glycoprotein [Clavulina sp. PMI_390]